MPDTTNQGLLTAVRNAIAARLNGGAIQAYTLPSGRNIQYVPLTDLIELERHYAARVLAESGGGTAYVEFERPS